MNKPSLILQLNDHGGLIDPPPWFVESVQYETIMGSRAYGASDNKSDKDVYGFCIPPLKVLFPHLAGDIEGFGTHQPSFNQFQKHHIKFEDGDVDVSIYNITRYFHLCLENNPNMIDSLFTHDEDVIFATDIAKRVREQRALFLHKGLKSKFKGYALSQINKIANKTNSSNEKRKSSIEEYGYDTKFAYHTVRLVLEASQLLRHGNVDLKLFGDLLRDIKNGRRTLGKVIAFTHDAIRELDDLAIKSPLPDKPQEDEIKKLLIRCIEEHHKVNLHRDMCFWFFG